MQRKNYYYNYYSIKAVIQLTKQFLILYVLFEINIFCFFFMAALKYLNLSNWYH